MKCPYCGTANQHQVVTSRATQLHIRRRRKCLSCGRRFSTNETISDITEAKLLKEDRRGANKSFRLLREDHAVLWENQAMMIGLSRRILRALGADDSLHPVKEMQPAQTRSRSSRS